MKRNEPQWIFKFPLWIVIPCLMINVQVNAQARRVTGTVTARNASADPLPGTTITVKGTNRQVTADESGKFTIEAAPNDVLVITSVGYTTQEQKVGNGSNVSVRLAEQYNSMNDVVVIGYGTMRKTDQSSAQVSSTKIHLACLY